MNELIDVAVPVGVRKTFAYSVPPEFRERITVGMRVLVPFGRKLVTGYVVGILDRGADRRLQIACGSRTARSGSGRLPVFGGDSSLGCAVLLCAAGRSLSRAFPHGDAGCRGANRCADTQGGHASQRRIPSSGIAPAGRCASRYPGAAKNL